MRESARTGRATPPNDDGRGERHADEAGDRGTRVAATSRKQGRGQALQRYSPVVLLVDLGLHLRARGLAVSETYEHIAEAIQASEMLLRSLGVEPDRSIARRPVDGTPVLAAAASLLRAVGIEPDDVRVWPPGNGSR